MVFALNATENREMAQVMCQWPVCAMDVNLDKRNRGPLQGRTPDAEDAGTLISNIIRNDIEA